MSEENIEQQEDEVVQKDELTILKERARLMGINFHPNIGLDNLRKKVNDGLSDGDTETEDDEEDTEAKPKNTKAGVAFKPETELEKRVRLRKESIKLIRVRVTCLNPNKKDWPGEIFTFSNSYTGTVRKFVPFNAEEGYHVPQVILNMVKERQFVHHYVEKRDGRDINKQKLVKEFAVEVLPSLTSEELKELAQRQALNHSID